MMNIQSEKSFPIDNFILCYSHSMVDGGLELMSYTTLFTPFTRLMISLDTFERNSYGRCDQSAVIPDSNPSAKISLKASSHWTASTSDSESRVTVMRPAASSSIWCCRRSAPTLWSATSSAGVRSASHDWSPRASVRRSPSYPTPSRRKSRR